ncbi:hypothetical protein E1B28_007687 [Marasmius oreades]|uniref:Uncharacterized protein n=1 Tax=Marasmius oreades TaxID=181124 RepID=A0A9P7UTQ8_9AGAR|nr:uncharacterized protein E1B28_007687 [Marasmius oreades]KAG7094067.1 hypothetical protein E1B28_007687 [Marasmius oreades]
MGLFKRILSLGSKKSKKKRPEIVHNVAVDEVGCRPQASTDDTEVAVNLLLRSSSSRYAVVSEMDCTSLPPLPHPINEVLMTPSASTSSLESTNLSRRGTYSVKVHPREQHTPRQHQICQENKSTPRALLHDTDADFSQLTRLRRDPSVASLLNMYDEHGHLPPQAFSDSPEKQGRAQTKRSGSTLRQLLGDPSKTDVNATEGDISWAERYLREGSSAATSMSSLILRTPDNPDYQVSETHNLLIHDNVQHDTTISSDHDLSSYYLNPAISSMEVELSVGSELNHAETDKTIYQNSDPRTPSRASQIFGFLTEKRRSQAPQDCDRSLPDPPSAFSSPSQTAHENAGNGPYLDQDPKTPFRASQVFRFFTERRGSRPPEDCERSLPDLPSVFSSPSDKDSTESSTSRSPSDRSSCNAMPLIPATPTPTATLSNLGHHRSHAISCELSEPDSKTQKYASQILPRAHSPFETGSTTCIGSHGGVISLAEQPGDTSDDVTELIQVRKVKVIMTVPTKVIVTAPTPSNNPEHNKLPTRIPRGPRSLQKRSTRNGLKEYRPSLLDRSNSRSTVQITDPFTPTISHPRKLHRTSSSTSLNSTDRHNSEPLKYRKSTTSGLREALQKENNLGLCVKNNLPFTPIRSNSSRSSLFRTVVTPSSFRPPPGAIPSPASSSELSPVGRQMMIDARNSKQKPNHRVEKDCSRRKTPKRSANAV